MGVRSRASGRRLVPLLLATMAGCGRIAYEVQERLEVDAAQAGGAGPGRGRGELDGGGGPIVDAAPDRGGGAGAGGARAGGAGGTRAGGTGGTAMGGTGGGGAGGMGGGGMGGVVVDAGTMTPDAAAGGSSAPSGQLPAGYAGFWKGTARNGGLNYPVEVALTGGALNDRIAIFFIANTWDCGGVGTFRSTNGNVVYAESLLFDRRSQCGPAGTTTVVLRGPDGLDYSFDDGRNVDRGMLARLPRGAESAVPRALTGFWSGTAAQTSPTGTRSVYLIVGDGAIGATAAYVIYPSQHCGGPLTLASTNGGSAVMREALSSMGSGCVLGGDLTITASGASLTYSWSHPAAATRATGTLARFR